MPIPDSSRPLPALRLTPSLELKLDASDRTAGAVSGYASVFGGPPDSHGDVIAPGAFARTIAEHQAEGTAPVMLWSHNAAEPIGRWTELREDQRGLFVRGVFNLETSRGKDAHAHVKGGDVSGLSIGFYTAPEGRRAGQQGESIITDVDLVEISVVARPAQRQARVTLASKRELVDLLHKSGLPRAAAQRLAAGGWPALAQDDPEEQSRIIKAAADRIERLTASLRT